MDGRGRCIDNILIERHWRSKNQQAIYLTEITDGFQARHIIRNWPCSVHMQKPTSQRIDFNNGNHPRIALGRRTPDEAYDGRETEKLAA